MIYTVQDFGVDYAAMGVSEPPKKTTLTFPSTDCWNGDFDKPLKIYKTIAGTHTCTEIPLEPSGDLFYKKLRSFVDAVKDGGVATVPSSQILYNQAIIDGIVKSNALGHEIEIEIPEI